MSKGKRNKRILIWVGILVWLIISYILCWDNHQFLPGLFDRDQRSGANVATVSAENKVSHTGNEKSTVVTTHGFDSIANTHPAADSSVAVNNNNPATSVGLSFADAAIHISHEKKSKQTSSNILPVPGNLQAIEPVDESNNDVAPPAAKFSAINSISPDKNIECKIVGMSKQDWLMIYPMNDNWGETYVIYPLAASAKKKLNYLIKRDFSGVTYPYYYGGKLKVHGKMEDVRMIRMKGSQPDAGYPYYLNLIDDPRFLIFGDYSNRNQWYIFENNTVKLFIATPDVQLDSLK